MYRTGLIIFISLFFLTGYFGLYEYGVKTDTIVNNFKNIKCENCHSELWNMTGVIVLPKKSEEFKKEIEKIDEEVKKNGKISFEQIIEKARRYEYLGDIGTAIKIYEENYATQENKESLVYNHNMAKLYEEVKSYNLAMERYRYLIDKQKRVEYLKDASVLFEIMGDKERAKEFLDAYNKYTKKDSNSGISLDVETK